MSDPAEDSTPNLRPFRLKPMFFSRPWGSEDLKPWFPNVEGTIGEAWFTANENLTAGGQTLGELVREFNTALLGSTVNEFDCCSLLVKFLFTKDRLSVQVHPDDEYAGKHENSRGKSEMWHVLRAEPGAQVALGFKERLTPERARQAAESGEIAALLDWRDVQAGDTFYTPAGTVHAIGAGLVICEIQQNSDITYRLYDYDRGRELHLDRGMAVADLGPYQAETAPPDHLVNCRHFAVTRHQVTEMLEVKPEPDRYTLLVILDGRGKLGDEPLALGQVWFLPAAAAPVPLTPEGSLTLLRVHCP